MILLYNSVTVIVMAAIAFIATGRLSRGDRSSANIAVLAALVIYAAPLLMDVIVGAPDYTIVWNMNQAQQDINTSIIYNFSIILLSLTLLHVGRSIWSRGALRLSAPQSDRKPTLKRVLLGYKNKKKIRFVFYITIAFLPIALVVLSPDPGLYLSYGEVALQGLSGPPENAAWYTAIAGAAALSVLGVTALILESGNPLRMLAYLLPILLSSVFIFGKRTLFILSSIMIILTLYHRRVLVGKNLKISLFIFVVVGMVFSFGYQTAQRGISFSNTSNGPLGPYEIARLDYGRDHTLKLAIFSELRPDLVKILPYRGASFIFDALFFILRSVWPGKPFTHAAYITGAAWGYDATEWTWGFTTSFMDQAISNLSWIGILIGPLFICFVCRVGDRAKSPLARLLTPVVAVLLLVLQIPAWLPIAALWLFALFRGGLRSSRELVRPRRFATR